MLLPKGARLPPQVIMYCARSYDLELLISYIISEEKP